METFDIRELRNRRRSHGGRIAQAINRHSERIYEADGRIFKLDRNLSTIPPTFELSYFPPIPADRDGVFAVTVPVHGQNTWIAISWDYAENHAKEAIVELLVANPDLQTHVPED